MGFGVFFSKPQIFLFFDVTVIVRGENKSADPQSVSRDVLDITAEDLKGFDVVVDAFGAWTEEELPLQHILEGAV